MHNIDDIIQLVVDILDIDLQVIEVVLLMIKQSGHNKAQNAYQNQDKLFG